MSNQPTISQLFVQPEHDSEARQVSQPLLNELDALGRKNAMHEEMPRAVEALGQSERHFHQMLDALPAAVYITDAEGRLTYFNPACVKFSGRIPELGNDHWCVTWKLFYPDGTPMPHNQCPMAIALKTGQTVRGAEAFALRPDGTRIWFAPYPTPLVDNAGRLIGGINMLVDITERKQAEEAKAMLAAIVESSDDAIVSKDLNGIIRSWNRGAERLFGYRADEVIGQPVTMLMPSDRVNEEPDILERIRRGEPVDHYETVRRRKDGTLVDISLTVSPIEDAQGRIIGASKVARDITQRRKAEQALCASEERYRQTLSLMPAAVYACDAAGVISYFNERAAQLWGRAPKIGDTDQRFCGSDQLILPDGTPLPHEQCPMAVALREGHSFRDAEINIRQPNGTIVPVLVNIDPIRDEHGEIVGAINAFHDVSAIKQAEQALREVDRRKDEFLATLAHELRGPLAPMRSVLEIMKRADGNDDLIRQSRDTMERQLGQVVRLVDDLFDVSRIRRGKIELKRERVELASVVYQAVEACRPLAEAAKHELIVTLPPEPIYLHVDPVRLAQVFGNLLNNACKYTESGGKIWLTAARQGDDVLVKAKDTGVGIPPEKLTNVFEMFSQVESSLERSQGGLGIGLTLVKRLVEMHEGTVKARSEGAGRGSEFIVCLPMLIENAQAEPQPEPNSERLVTARRILVVDDNRDAATSLAMLLKIAGSDTRTAHDGLDAIEQAEAYKPAVILLDIGLPKMNGYEACRRIREQSWGQDIIMVALTGWGQEEDRRKSEEAGFNGHLVKPVDYAALTRLLADLQANS